MIVVDSTVWVDHLADHPTEQTIWLEREMSRLRIGITDSILMEVLQGVRSRRDFQKIRRYLAEHFEVFDTGGGRLAVGAAQNYRLLRARGFTVRKPIDCLIATFCLAENHTLLHRHRDFDPFEQHLGLKVVHPVRQ